MDRERKSGGAVLVWYTDESNAQVEHAWYDATPPEFARAAKEIAVNLTICPEWVAHIRVRAAGKDGQS